MIRFQTLNEEARSRLVANLAGHICGAQEFIQKRAVGNFAQVGGSFCLAIFLNCFVNYIYCNDF